MAVTAAEQSQVDDFDCGLTVMCEQANGLTSHIDASLPMLKHV